MRAGSATTATATAGDGDDGDGDDGDGSGEQSHGCAIVLIPSRTVIHGHAFTCIGMHDTEKAAPII